MLNEKYSSVSSDKSQQGSLDGKLRWEINYQRVLHATLIMMDLQSTQQMPTLLFVKTCSVNADRLSVVGLAEKTSLPPPPLPFLHLARQAHACARLVGFFNIFLNSRSDVKRDSKRRCNLKWKCANCRFRGVVLSIVMQQTTGIYCCCCCCC